MVFASFPSPTSPWRVNCSTQQTSSQVEPSGCTTQSGRRVKRVPICSPEIWYMRRTHKASPQPRTSGALQYFALALYQTTPSGPVLVLVNFMSNLSRSFLSTATSRRKGASSSRRQLYMHIPPKSDRTCDVCAWPSMDEKRWRM